MQLLMQQTDLFCPDKFPLQAGFYVKSVVIANCDRVLTIRNN